jgi:acyl-coenzyme A synthetase/AMP-(fatty) acid ligase
MNVQFDFQDILSNGVTIHSSGTSGIPVAYFQSPAKIKIANDVARKRQFISKSSKIYTCCKITHAGGLLAQTVPAFEIGAAVDIEDFNAYTFVRKIKNYTHSHITPLHAKAIMMTKGFYNLDLTGIHITCGAEPVTWDIIEAFVNRGATVLVNWGMSEVGPIAINILFKTADEVDYFKGLCPSNATILGNVTDCDYKIVDSELWIKGDISIYQDWYATKDRVIEIDGILFYQGRLNKDIDLWTPTKG